MISSKVGSWQFENHRSFIKHFCWRVSCINAHKIIGSFCHSDKNSFPKETYVRVFTILTIKGSFRESESTVRWSEVINCVCYVHPLWLLEDVRCLSWLNCRKRFLFCSNNLLHSYIVFNSYKSGFRRISRTYIGTELMVMSWFSYYTG